MLGLSLCLVIKGIHLYADDTSWAVVYEDITVVGQADKLWRWKRSHHEWILQFK